MKKNQQKINKKNEIVEFAKNLFLSVNEIGEHIHSFRQISTQIQQEYKQNINYSTVANWAKKFGWIDMFEDGRKLGISKKIAEKIEQGVEVDEAYTEEISKAYASYFDTENTIYNEASKLIKLKIKWWVDEIKKDPSKANQINIQEFSGLKENSLRNLRLMLDLPTDKTEIQVESDWNLAALSDEEIDNIERLRQKSAVASGDRKD